MKNFNISISLISAFLIRSQAYAQSEVTTPAAPGASVPAQPTSAKPEIKLEATTTKLEMKPEATTPKTEAKEPEKSIEKDLKSASESEPKDTKKITGENESCAEKNECDDILAENERESCLEKASLSNVKRLGELYKVFKQKMRRQLAEDNRKLKQNSNSRILVDTVKADKETQSRLVTAENAWIQFRDANCYLIAAESIGGSGEGQQYSSCINSMTKRRIDELQKISERIFSQ